MSGETLAAQAAAADVLDRLARDGVEWAGAQAGALGIGDGLIRDLRRDARRARAIRHAASRPVAVAVFGASQAGKSYLVSRLAAPLGKPVFAAFGDTRADFLREINPEGGNESTGLVTRFTIKAPPAPPDAPVALRLLTQSDIVKILINTYLEDFAPDESAVLSPEEQQAHIEVLDRMAGPAACDGLDEDTVEDLRDYLLAHFRDRQLIATLSSNFWTRLGQVAPRIPIERRAEAWAPFWGRSPTFTRLCTELFGALKALGFAQEVRAGMDALIPRETSVIDVQTLYTLGRAGAAGTVSLKAAGGGAGVPVPRASAAALIAELVVPLAEKPWDFFDHTDLLDFPGARSREDIPDLEAFMAAQPDNLGRSFLRGKVAYLFQRYNAEQEISAMLLCVGPSVQDVQTLPRMVDDWIRLTAGTTPAQRAQRPPNLFLVLTKFDTEFESKGGEDVASGVRWTNRLNTNLLDFFGKAYEWPREWAPGTPFRNVFWLRNPAVGFAAVFDYAMRADGAKEEAGVASRAREFVEERRSAYLNNALVRTHFQDPALAWDEALRPNDGGIGHLARSLAPICDPGLKAHQLKLRTAAVARDIASRLRGFHRGEDADERKKEARRRAQAAGRALLACAKAQMLGPLLRAMMVDNDAVAAVAWRQRADVSTGAPVIGTIASAHDYDELLGDLLGEPEKPAAAKPGLDAPRDPFEHLAGLAIEDWEARMRSLAEAPETETTFHIPRPVLIEIASELAQAARRTRLRDRIAETIRVRAAFQGRADTMEPKRIAIVEEMVNSFVHHQGWQWTEAAKRPRNQRDGRPIFLEHEPEPTPPRLSPQPAAFDVTFNVDWIMGLAALMEGNADSDTGEDFDIAANARLGKVLTGLGALLPGTADA